MNILVTGGAGYIGTSLVEALNELENVQKIFVLDNLSKTSLSFFIGKKVLEKVSFIKGDILDSYIVEDVIKKVNVIYHLAGYVTNPYNYAQNVQYEQVNQWGTLNLVRCVQRVENKIDRFIFLSSASVWGLKGAVSVNDEPQPTNAYGKSKWEAEKYVRLLADICKVNIVRSANVFGFNNNFRDDSVLNHFIFKALVEKKILIYGDGTQTRPFVSLNQIINDLLCLLQDKRNVPVLKTSVEFNANMNDIKDWLLEKHIPELEYTYINRNIEYDGQSIIETKAFDGNPKSIEVEFLNFKKNIIIKNRL